MSRPHMTLEAWRETLRERIEPVGYCHEWTGPFMGVTPLAYCPRGYLYEGSLQARHTVRTALWCIKHSRRAPAGQVIRSTCGNDRCVGEHHWLILDRKSQSREQARRFELQTVSALTAKMRSARSRSKLTAADAAAIRASDEPAKVECLKYGVTPQTVNAVRSGRIWRASAPWSSVFAPGPGAAQSGGRS